MLTRRDEVAASINDTHRHAICFTGYELPPNLTATTDPRAALDSADFIVYESRISQLHLFSPNALRSSHADRVLTGAGNRMWRLNSFRTILSRVPQLLTSGCPRPPWGCILLGVDGRTAHRRTVLSPWSLACLVLPHTDNPTKPMAIVC